MKLAYSVAITALAATAAAESCFPEGMCPGIEHHSFSCELPNDFDNCDDYRIHVQLELDKTATDQNDNGDMIRIIANWVAEQSQS
ncbi:hypothetical protein A1Q2_00013 [Trichosporon asahii var. asahii CBS 8904]|uniref:Uncharacterized protein n=1 Tax=Trichosporon asahii var. asahii (strain CBS 8904) TaxID=1220162 RepID=K1WYI6_TRIAC|nr:hypothetical protein A1Q2_00013 [Trichosporon asahii var. asahii CBS 8904]